MSMKERSATNKGFPLRRHLEEALDIYKALSKLMDEQRQAIKDDDLAKLCGVVMRKEKLIREIMRVDGFIRSIGGPKEAQPGQAFKVDKEDRLIAREAASVLSKIMSAEKESIDTLKFRLEVTKQELRKLGGEERSMRSYAYPRPMQPMFLDLRR